MPASTPSNKWASHCYKHKFRRKNNDADAGEEQAIWRMNMTGTPCLEKPELSAETEKLVPLPQVQQVNAALTSEQIVTKNQSAEIHIN